MDLRWSPLALRDLQRVHGFLKTESPKTAIEALTKIKKSGQNLPFFPNIGVQIGNDADFRQLTVAFGKQAYILHYRIHHTSIVVLRVWHSKENRK